MPLHFSWLDLVQVGLDGTGYFEDDVLFVTVEKVAWILEARTVGGVEEYRRCRCGVLRLLEENYS